MHRTGLLCIALLSTLAHAQERLPAGRSFPVTGEPRDAGTVDVTTGRWTRPGQSTKQGALIVYDNTCTWTTQAYYAGFDWCEENYDEGRIPSPSSPGAPDDAQVANPILSVRVSYCTYAGPLAAQGGYDMDLAFWDSLGGDCAGSQAPTPPPVSSTATAWFPLAGLGLPGSTSLGMRTCWLVTLDTSNAGFVLQSDGDGSYDGTPAQDSFTWMQRQNTTVGALQIAGKPDGFYIAGEPAIGGYGSCSYDIPCGVSVNGPCGTGLDTFDGSWINVDGVGVGASGQPAGCANSIAQYGFGSNCYFFGGYPSGPLASYYLVLESQSDAGPSTYCTQSKTTSVAGCTASLTATDTSLATGLWRATDIPRQAGLGAGTVLGVFFYTDGAGIGQSTFQADVPFGRLCLSGFKRSSPACAPALLTGVQPGLCNPGPMTTAPACNGGALGIAVGEDVNVQLWYRDPGSAGDANLSNAIFYTVQ
jgi:hypothetical protein